MLWLRAAASNTPLWSLILAKTGGLFWLEEVNRLVCVTMSQATTPLPGVVAYTLPLPLGLLGNSPMYGLPLLGSVVGGGVGE